LYDKLKTYYWDDLSESRVQKYFDIRDDVLKKRTHSSLNSGIGKSQIDSYQGSVQVTHFFDMSGAP
jgi:hypothetical protein